MSESAPAVATEAGPATDPAEATPTPIAAAAAEATTPQQEPQREMSVIIAGPVFFNICSYVGSKPVRQVVNLRRALYQIQQEQNAFNPQALPQKVWMTASMAQGLHDFLMDCPCDEVFNLLSSYEQELQTFSQEQQRSMQEAQEAAAKAALSAAAASASATEAAQAAERATAGAELKTEDAPAGDGGPAAVESAVVTDPVAS